MRYEQRYDVRNYKQPENCTGCRFIADPARAVVDMRCPVHGANGDPVVGPPNWPELRTVPVED